MGNTIKWWKSFKVWQQVGMILTPLAAGGEIALVVNSANPLWHFVTVTATIASVYITKIMTDNDGDGIVDQMQTKK